MNLLARSALVSAQEAEKGVGQEVASELLLSLAKKVGALPQAELPTLMQSLSISSETPPLGWLMHWCTSLADTRRLAEWDINMPGKY